MKKITALILVVLFLAACTPKNQSTTEEINAEVSAESTIQEAVTDISSENQASTGTQTQSSTTTFASIKAAMMAKIPYSCTYSEDGNIVTVTVKGEKFKTEGTTSQGTAYALSDGSMMYAWMGQQGVKYSVADMKKFAQQQESVQQSVDIDKNYEMNCMPTIASDALFVPPGNVEFQDMAQMMQQIQEAMAGGNIPSGYN